MLAIMICKDGVREGIGMPSVYFKNDDLNFILQSEEARMDLISIFGNGVCIGMLGERSSDGCYVEPEIHIGHPESESEGDLGYYAIV